MCRVGSQGGDAVVSGSELALALCRLMTHERPSEPAQTELAIRSLTGLRRAQRGASAKVTSRVDVVPSRARSTVTS